MKSTKLIILLALLFLSAAFLSSCNSGDGSAIIGPEGGVVEVKNPSNPLYGVKIEIPPAALTEDTNIKILKPQNPPPFPTENDDTALIVEIQPSGTIFQVSATVTIPYKNKRTDFLAVFTAEDGSTTWEQIPVYEIKQDLKVATCQIAHLSYFSVGDVPGVSPGRKYNFFFKGGSTTYAAVNGIINETIRDVIKNGTWKEMTDCIDVTFEETNDEFAADIIIQWADLEPFVEDGDTFFPYAKTSPTLPRTITINNNFNLLCAGCDLHYTIDENIGPREVDLYSVIANEMGHIVGLIDTKGNTDEVMGENQAPGDNIRDLQEADKTKFEKRYPVIFINKTPTGIISDKRPNVSVIVKSPCDYSVIDTASIKLTLDGVSRGYTSITSADGSEVTVSFLPESDLTSSNHYVQIEASNDQRDYASISWYFEIKTESGSLIGNWLLINFLSLDDDGVWCGDDPSGIGMSAVVSEKQWVQTDYNNGCKITYSFTIDKDLKYKRQGIDISKACDFYGINPSLLDESGHLQVYDNSIMIDYFDMQPGDDIVAFKWMRQ